MKIDFDQTPFRHGAVGAMPNRLNWRTEILLTRNLPAIQNKRILDIACADSRFSYACYQLGAAHVTGVEGRPSEVERGSESLQALGCDPTRWTLVASDVFDYLPRCQPGQFDTILCFGFFYHTIRQVEMVREFVRLRPKTIIMDTSVVPERGWLKLARFAWRLRRHPNPAGWRELWNSVEGDEVMYFKTEHADHPSASILHNFRARADWEVGHPIAGNFKPTESLVERLFDLHGIGWRQIDWRKQGVGSWVGLEDYRGLTRVSYIADL